jgi:HSP20 family protein
MENYFLNKNVHYVYPGEYTPLPEMETLQEELKIKRCGTVLEPLINCRETKTAFELKVAIPGAKRENLLIAANENALSIALLHKDPDEADQSSFQLHEFNYECFERHILLPPGADIEFACADYNDGILHIYIPKTEVPAKPVKNELRRIVVY